jgi:hypothetical protein
MIHGTKMILVPQELAKALHGDLPQAPAPVGSYSAMDSEMSAILKTKTDDDYTKWQQYNNVLQRYMAKMERTKNSLSITIESDDEADAAAAQPQTPVKPSGSNDGSKKATRRKTDTGTAPAYKKAALAVKKKASVKSSTKDKSIILESFKILKNATQKKKARDLLNLLDNSEEAMWSKAGNLKIKGKSIGPLSPLVRHTVTGAKGIEPAGWGPFSSFIANLTGAPTSKASSSPAPPAKGTRKAASSNQLIGNGSSWITY